jgi:hypothetical protein
MGIIINRENVACSHITRKKDLRMGDTSVAALRMGDTSVASKFLNLLGYFLNIVACRLVATQRPRNKQLGNGP